MARFIYQFSQGEHQVVDRETGEIHCRYEAGYPAHAGAARRCARRMNEEVSRDD